VLAVTALPVVALGAVAATQLPASATHHSDSHIAIRLHGRTEATNTASTLSDERISVRGLRIDNDVHAQGRARTRDVGAIGATPGNIGTIGVSVGCVGQNHQMVMTPSATEGSAWDKQWVAYRLAYTSNGQTYYTGWYQPQLVDGVVSHSSYLTGDFTTSQLQSLGSVTASNVSGVGQVWVRGAFWNGSAYEYSDWVGADLYTRFINGGSLGGSGAPCVIY
jgi:hypothetical protein